MKLSDGRGVGWETEGNHGSWVMMGQGEESKAKLGEVFCLKDKLRTQLAATMNDVKKDVGMS